MKFLFCNETLELGFLDLCAVKLFLLFLCSGVTGSGVLEWDGFLPMRSTAAFRCSCEPGWDRRPGMSIRIPAEDVTVARISEACKLNPSCLKQASSPSARAKPLIIRGVTPPLQTEAQLGRLFKGCW